jgi:hypothetical protein
VSPGDPVKELWDIPSQTSFGFFAVALAAVRFRIITDTNRFFVASESLL